MLTNLTWDQFCLNVALLKEHGLHPCQGLHKIPVSQNTVSSSYSVHVLLTWEVF